MARFQVRNAFVTISVQEAQSLARDHVKIGPLWTKNRLLVGVLDFLKDRAKFPPLTLVQKFETLQLIDVY